jgi:hypothetical protein
MSNINLKYLADQATAALYEAMDLPCEVAYYQHGMVRARPSGTRCRTYYTNFEEFTEFVEEPEMYGGDGYHGYNFRAWAIGGEREFLDSSTICLENASDHDIAKATSMVQSLFVGSSYSCPEIVKTPKSGCPVCSKGGESLKESGEISGSPAGSASEIKRIAKRTVEKSYTKLKKLVYNQ